MAFDYDALEVELVGVLNTYFGANPLSDDVLLNTVFDARQMPENQVELLQDYDKSLVNVQYVDSIYMDPESTSSITQEETIKVICYLQCNAMKGPSGGYKLLACVKEWQQRLTYKLYQILRQRLWRFPSFQIFFCTF